MCEFDSLRQAGLHKDIRNMKPAANHVNSVKLSNKQDCKHMSIQNDCTTCPGGIAHAAEDPPPQQHLYETMYQFGCQTDFESYERNRLLRDLLPRFVIHGQTILDVACNDGAVMEYFVSQGLNPSGLDISRHALAFATQRGLQNVKQGDVEKEFPYPDASFDHVFWGDNAEHLLQPLKTLREIGRVLRKPNGYLFMSVPNMGCVRYRLHYLLHGAPPRTEGHDNPPWLWEHIRFFNTAILQQFLHAGGFEVLHLFGCHRRKSLDPLARRFPAAFATLLLAVARPRAVQDDD